MFTCGCASLAPAEPSARPPVLVSLAVANDTDRVHEYEIRVRFAPAADEPLETVFRTEGTLRARTRREVDGDWREEPGRYAVGIAVDGAEWNTHDVADRLTQDEQICYRQELSIGADGITSLINVNADCPDRTGRNAVATHAGSLDPAEIL